MTVCEHRFPVVAAGTPRQGVSQTQSEDCAIAFAAVELANVARRLIFAVTAGLKTADAERALQHPSVDP